MINIEGDCVKVGNKYICWDTDTDTIIEFKGTVIDAKSVDQTVLYDLLKKVSHKETQK